MGNMQLSELLAILNRLTPADIAEVLAEFKRMKAKGKC